MFQSTRPRGARRSGLQSSEQAESFNPRAREGRDRHGAGAYRKLIVSIHAPARGATSAKRVILSFAAFQSTRPRGARRLTASRPKDKESFNPRAREGRDRPLMQMSLAEKLFQSTRPRGARRYATRPRVTLIRFQSTRPRGARHHRCDRLTRGHCFNPRAREGRDFTRRRRTGSLTPCFNPRAREGRDIPSRKSA